MNLSTQNFDRYVFSKHPDYDEAAVRKEFGEVYPGDIITDAQGSLVTEDKGTSNRVDLVIKSKKASSTNVDTNHDY